MIRVRLARSTQPTGRGSQEGDARFNRIWYEAGRALARLVDLGALVRTERGRYMIHPSAAWNGSLTEREAAARKLTAAGPESPT